MTSWRSDSTRRACARISRALLLRNRFKRWASVMTDGRCTTVPPYSWRKQANGESNGALSDPWKVRRFITSVPLHPPQRATEPGWLGATLLGVDADDLHPLRVDRAAEHAVTRERHRDIAR